MIKQSGAVSVALLLLCSLCCWRRKNSVRRRSASKGAPQYTQQELLAAAGLKPNARLNSREVKAHAKQCSDTGLFREIKFTSDSKTLLFTLTLSSELFPMHLENVPLKPPGKELDAKLHERFPLYHGLLPANGSMLEGTRQTLVEMLAAESVKASVKAAVTSGLGPQKLTAINFTMLCRGCISAASSWPASSAMQAKANLLASGQTGNSFDTENTAAGLQRAFEDLYQDQGYAAVRVDVAEVDPLVVSDQSVDIPYAVTIKEGGIYKLGTIDFPANTLVARRCSENPVQIPDRFWTAARSVSPGRPRCIPCEWLSRLLHRFAPFLQ